MLKIAANLGASAMSSSTISARMSCRAIAVLEESHMPSYS